MKNTPITLISRSAALILSMAATLPGLQAAPSAPDFNFKWDMSQTVETPVGTAIEEKSSGNNIVFLSGNSTKIEADTEARGGKALVFDGTQTAAASSLQKLVIGENIRLAAQVKPVDSANMVDWQTVVYIFQQCELRYAVKRGQILFIVWYGADGKTAAEVGCPINPNKWNDIEATVVGSKMELRVNGLVMTQTIPGEGTKKTDSNVVGVGFANGRAFTGRIADLQISLPKFN
ncbi:MAG: LamG-like jellyroll fold domain-containing protein [Candidatus Methylacidiphilales bacterium]|nr:LamG-like jellyroll fold domain-containing protein [Candidatus Methylacidiphilales bacterium]